MKAKRDLKQVIKEIANLVEGPVSAEVIASDAPGMIEEAHELVKLGSNVVVKIPMTPEGLKAVAVLSKEGIKTNVTLIFSANQALLATRAGATYVSPFVGRIDDISMDGLTLIQDIADIFAIHGINTEIIAASVRTPLHILQCAKSLEFARVVEAAALRSGRLLGRGQKDEADGLAVDAMRQAFDSVRISGTVVIGEGEIDEAPMLYIGEHVGAGGPEVDIAVDPIEGTNLIAKGQNGAIAVMAIAEKGGLLHAPDMYMEKICVGPRGAGAIDITKSLTENIQNVAAKMGRKVDEINLVMLDRERHHGLMKEARDLGARIMLISDGDVNPAMECCIEGSGVHMVVGTGGAPEGVLAAAALKCAGGDMQARLKPGNEEEIRRCHEMGVKDVNQVLTLDDLVRTDDVIFAATAITRGNLLNPIQYFPGGARTHTIVMRSKTGTVRFLDTIHRDEKLTTLKAR